MARCGVDKWLGEFICGGQVVLARLSRIHLASTSLWRQVQVWGAKFGAVLEAERQQ